MDEWTLRDLLSERTGQLRRLASYAAYAVDGCWLSDDPWPERLDELCDKLRAVGCAKRLELNP